VIFPNEFPIATASASAVLTRQEALENSSQYVKTKLFWSMINRPAVMGETGDGCQISSTGERLSDSNLFMRVSMLGRI